MCWPKVLLVAEKMIEGGQLEKHVLERYSHWQQSLGQQILTSQLDLDGVANIVESDSLNPKPISGQQELLENKFNTYLDL